MIARSPTEGTDAASRLWWALRHYLPLLLLLSALGGIAGMAASSASNDRYETAALIVATPSEPDELGNLAEGLPHFAQAIFNNGQVAERAVTQGTLPIDPDELTGQYVQLEPIELTPVIRVKGSASDPGLAASAANEVAVALVAEMNSASTDIATFKVQENARIPDKALAGPSRPKSVLIGILAGFLLAAGIASLYVLARKPIVGPDEATKIAGLPLIGMPRLSRRSGSQSPGETPGLGALVKSLFDGSTVRCAFVSCRGAEKEASRLATLTTRRLAEEGRVVFLAIGKDAKRLAAAQAQHENVEIVEASQAIVAAGTPPIDEGRAHVVIGGLTIGNRDISNVLPEGTACALVVRGGVAQAAVEDAASQFVESDLAGLVFVRGR